MDVQEVKELCSAEWPASGDLHLTCNLPPNHAEDDHETDFGGGTVFWHDELRIAKFVMTR